MLGSAPDGEPILNPQVMCLYICNTNTEGRGGGGSWCLLEKSEIADSSPALAFKFQRNKMYSASVFSTVFLKSLLDLNNKDFVP